MDNTNISENEIHRLSQSIQDIEKWHSPIKVKASICDVKILSQIQSGETLQFPTPIEGVDIFSLVDEPRHKHVIVFDQAIFRPSNTDSWKNLYKYL